MWMSFPHIVVLFNYTNRFSYFLSRSRWLHIFIASILLLISFMPLCVTQNHKYSPPVCPKKELSIFHLSPFSFSLFSVNCNFCKWSVQYSFSTIKSLSMYARITSNPWNKSFIFCWKISGELAIPIGRRL